MIYPSTNLVTMDNSGAKKVKCIKVYKKPGRARTGAKIGDLIQVIIVSLRNRGLIRVKKGEIYTGIVTRISTVIFRKNKGYYIKFDLNAIIILSKKKLPIGTRLIGPASKELRNKHFIKIASLSIKLI
jgi:large subunit ribosomal protein L14